MYLSIIRRLFCENGPISIQEVVFWSILFKNSFFSDWTFIFVTFFVHSVNSINDRLAWTHVITWVGNLHSNSKKIINFFSYFLFLFFFLLRLPRTSQNNITTPFHGYLLVLLTKLHPLIKITLETLPFSPHSVSVVSHHTQTSHFSKGAKVSPNPWSLGYEL